MRSAEARPKASLFSRYRTLEGSRAEFSVNVLLIST
jgi:hypothetical protein